MTVNRYDQASRYAAKLDAVGFVSWLLREEPANLRFRGWLDTRTLPFPGDPERTCDTVAWLSDTDPAVEWAMWKELEGVEHARIATSLGMDQSGTSRGPNRRTD